MRRGILVIIAAAALAGMPAIGAAQDGGACPVIVQTALLMAEQLCGDTARNELCYGHTRLVLEPRSDAPPVTFDGLGDRVSVTTMGSLQASPMDVATGEWGVALARLQANLPDALPGQNVTLLIFGDAQVAAAAAGSSEPVRVVTGSGAMVVDQPSLAGMPLAGPMVGITLLAEGRTADNLWLRVRLADGTPGWLMAMMADGDWGALPVVDESGGLVGPQQGEQAAGAPLQAFIFTTGLGDAPCQEAPDSGLLIQTPLEGGPVAMLINETRVIFGLGEDCSACGFPVHRNQLGVTTYLQAEADGEMTLSVIEGQVDVAAAGVIQTAVAGAQVRVPLDADGVAAAAPLPPEPYNEALMNRLPLGLLDRPVEPPPGATWMGTGSGGGATGGGANLVQNGDFAIGFAGWLIEQDCDACGMQTNIDLDPAKGDYLAWARSSSGQSGGAIWARQPLNLDMATCPALHIAFDVRVDSHTLPNSGWWTDGHGGNGEYPAMVRLAFRPAYQGSQFDWARGFLVYHDGATQASNYTLVPAGGWTHYEADVLSPAEWVDAFGNVQTNPGILTDIYVGGSGWDFMGGIDNIVLTCSGGR